jgi:DNA-binding transcriptional regulator GbsR (MarR family)
MQHWTSRRDVYNIHYLLNDVNVLNLLKRTQLVHPSTRQLIERVGLLCETDGLPRIAGRIFGLLIVTPGECSLDDMAETLGVSKASISTDARRLEQFGIVVRTSRPGDRRDYYAIAPNALRQSLETKMRGMRQFQELLREARDLPDASSEVRERIDEWDAWYDDALEVMATLVEKATHARTSASSRRR